MVKYEHVEVNNDFKAKISYFSNKKNPTYFAMHFHNSTELLYCEKGSLHLRLYDEDYTIKEGDMVFINSNIPHETKSLEPNQVYMLQIRQPFIDNLAEEINLNTIDNPEFKNTEYFDVIKELMKEMYSIKKLQETFYEYNLLSKLEYLKYNLLKSSLRLKNRHESHSVESQIKIMEVMNYIDKNYSSGIRVSEVAHYFDYTIPYFSNFFKEKTGMTCSDYIQTRRLHEAMRLLSGENKSIIDVSYEVGFCNIKSMRRMFKLELGVTPSEYLEIHGSEGN